MQKVILIMVFSVFLLSTTFAGEPTIQLQKHIKTIESILKSKNSRRSGRVKDSSVEQIRQILEQFFSWQEMARRAVGYKTKKWVAVPRSDRDAYVKALKALLEETYVGRLNEYNGQSFVFPEGGERIFSKGRKAEVKSYFELTDKQVPVVYKMFLHKGIWWVYDVKVEGVGMVMNYKNQFEPIVAKGGIPEVTKRLKRKMLALKAKRGKKR